MRRRVAGALRVLPMPRMKPGVRLIRISQGDKATGSQTLLPRWGLDLLDDQIAGDRTGLRRGRRGVGAGQDLIGG